MNILLKFLIGEDLRFLELIWILEVGYMILNIKFYEKKIGFVVKINRFF